MSQGGSSQSVSRTYLKRAFAGGLKYPVWEALVNSSILKSEEADFNSKYGLILKGSEKETSRLLSMFRENKASWSLGLDENGSLQLSKESLELSTTVLHFSNEGKIGLGKKANYDLDVAGTIAMESRVGTFAQGKASADGKWHEILRHPKGCQAFEVFAHLQDSTDLRYALTYAIVMISGGKGGGGQKVIQSYATSRWFWGKVWNRIQFRWKRLADQEGFSLQVRSRTFWGQQEKEPKQIVYRLCKIYDEAYEQSNEYKKEEYNFPKSAPGLDYRPKPEERAFKDSVIIPQNPQPKVDEDVWREL